MSFLHSAGLLDNEDPPDDYRCLSVIPQQDDIHPNGPVFIRRNKVEGSYDGPGHYLDVQFRLLREDFIRPLREGIAALSESSGIDRKPSQVGMEESALSTQKNPKVDEWGREGCNIRKYTTAPN